MCGIAGVIDRRRPVARPVLEAMADAVAHRGPDDHGVFLGGAVGLAHRRLSIIDLAAGHQPMRAGSCTIVFNGEIYNYLELRRELVSRGHRFSSDSDTEVILRLYLEHGADCVALLNGMFAFLLHDPHRDRLLVARDHFGIKPLYYHQSDGLLAYVSEMKSLWRHPDITPRPDYEGIKEYLTLQYVLGDRTMFQDVYKVLPGHFQVVDLKTGAISTTRYWEPDFSVREDRSEDQLAEELRALLADSVRLQIRSDVPVGAHLSGGMDSSIVSLLASEHIEPLSTFTGSFAEGPAFDETRHARTVADVCSAQAHEVVVTDRDFVDLFPSLVYHMDEPAAGPGVLPQFVVSRLAASRVKVVLGGQGGDEIFGGYARYVVAYLEQALKGAMLETNEEGEHIVSLASIIPNLPHLRSYVPMLQQFWRQGVFEPMDRRYFRLVDRSGRSLSLYTRDFRDSYEHEAVFARFQDLFNHPDTLSYYNKMTHYDLMANLPALLQVEDRVSMANSLESRVPLLDYRVVDLVAAAPPILKFRGGEMKYILKRAVRDLVPASILDRKDKMGFPVPLHMWKDGPAGAMIRDLLSSSAARHRGLFDPAEVEKLIEYEGAFSRRLWGLTNLELWFQTFIDNHSTTA